eukprot:Sspe_Gene.25283::Locus_10142_Transcript_10_10_Confidence_0.300_Length_863::g.25283::m.25283
MDCDVAASYKVERLQRDIHGEIEEAALIKTGLKKEFVWRSACPNPADLGLIGDNLLKKSDKMAWWKGQDVEVGGEEAVVRVRVLHGPARREERERGVTIALDREKEFFTETRWPLHDHRRAAGPP